MPEIDDSMRTAPHETRTVNNVSLAHDDRLEQERIVLGVVLQICILNNDDLASRRPKSGSKARALALIDLMVKRRVDAISQLFLDHFAGPVRRAIVHQHDLQGGDRTRADGANEFPDRVSFVVTGNDN